MHNINNMFYKSYSCSIIAKVYTAWCINCFYFQLLYTIVNTLGLQQYTILYHISI